MMRTALRLTSFRDDVVLGDASITLQEAVPLLFLTRPPKHVVPLVIPELCRPREKRDVRSFNILSLGRLHPEKNYTELIYAAALLKREGYSGS